MRISERQHELLCELRTAELAAIEDGLVCRRALFLDRESFSPARSMHKKGFVNLRGTRLCSLTDAGRSLADKMLEA